MARNRFLDALKGEQTSEADVPISTNKFTEALKSDATIVAPTTTNKFIEALSKPTYTAPIPEPSVSSDSEVQLAQNTFDPDKNKEISQLKDPVNAALRTGMATLAQLNRPYSSASGAIESGIKELTTPATEEYINRTDPIFRTAEKLVNTGGAVIKGGWEGLLSNAKGATDPLKAAVEVVRGKDSKMQGEPGTTGTIKDILSNEGLENVRPIIDFVGALGIPGVTRGIDPLSYTKSVLPFSTTVKGENISKTMNLKPSVLERMAEGQQGFAPQVPGGPMEKLTNLANIPVQYTANKLLEAGSAIDKAPAGSWTSLLKTPKTAFNSVVEAGKDAVFNRTGDPLKDELIDTGFKVDDIARYKLNQTMQDFIGAKESSLQGGFSQVDPSQVERALHEGFTAAETPNKIVRPSIERPSVGLNDGLVPDFRESLSFMLRRAKDRILNNDNLHQADKNALIKKLEDKYLRDVKEHYPGELDPLQLDELNTSAYQTSKVDREIFDKLGEEEAGMRYKSGMPTNHSPISNILSVETPRTLRKVEKDALDGLDIFTTQQLKDMTTTDDLHNAFLEHVRDNAGDYVEFQKVQTPQHIDNVTEKLKLVGVDNPAIKMAQDRQFADSLRRDVEDIQGLRNSTNPDERAIGNLESNRLFDRLKIYSDNGAFPGEYANKMFKSAKTPAFNYVTHSLDPDALAVLEAKAGEAITPTSLAKKFSVDSKHSSDISRTYKDSTGRSYPVNLVNLANKVKNKGTDGFMAPELHYTSEMYGFSPEDMRDLTNRLKNIYGDYTGKIFDTDPMRTVVTRAVGNSKASAADNYFREVERMADSNRDPRLIRIPEGQEAPKGLITSKHPEIPDIAATPDVMKIIDSRLDSIKDIGAEKLFGTMYKELLSLWKQSATSGIGIPRWAFSITNLASEVYKNKQAGVDVGGQAYKDALKVMSMDKGSKWRDSFKTHTIELPGQGEVLDGIAAPHIGSDGIKIMGPGRGGTYQASDILKLAQKHGVVDSGFASQDISRVLDSNPELGKASFDLLPTGAHKIDLENIDFSKPNAIPDLTKATQKVYPPQIRDYFNRHNTLPTKIDNSTRYALPVKLQQYYEPALGEPVIAGVKEWKLRPDVDLNFDDIQNIMDKEIPSPRTEVGAGLDSNLLDEVSGKYEKAIEPLPPANKFKRWLENAKSPILKSAGWLEGKGFTGTANALNGLSDVLGSGGTFARWSENYARMTNFIDKLKKGYTPEMAAKIVKDTAFNYSDISDTVKGIKNVFPFATFTAKNLPFQMKQALGNQKPLAGTAQTLIALNSEPKTEEQLKSMSSDKKNNMPVRVPEWFRKMFDKDGMDSFVNIGRYIPSTQLGNLDVNEMGQAAKNIVGSAGPYKLIYELMANKSLFNGQPIESFEGEKAPAFGGTTTLPAKTEYALRNLIPAYSQAETLALPTRPAREGSLSLPERLLRIGTGINITREDLDENQLQRANEFKATVNRLKQELKRADRDGNLFKVKQIEDYLSDPSAIERLLDKGGLK